MPSMTIKNIPEALLNRVRERAAAERRSVNMEVLQLVEQALDGDVSDETANTRIARQVAAWRALGGTTTAATTTAWDVDAIYAARTKGRAVDL